ncbi:MAG: glucose-6-phosphate isomerase [Gammaproteobacteria bacterium]
MPAPIEKIRTELANIASAARGVRTASLFAATPDRAARFTAEGAGLILDYSKNPLNEAALTSLFHLADAASLATRIGAMFNGEVINFTEQRPALHTALRRSSGITIDGINLDALVEDTKTRMRELVREIHQGHWLGYSGQRITDVVNIGIGGSHLGPLLACEALREEALGHVAVHFVSNVDGGDIASKLARLDPARTLFIVASKSFTTPETALNARTAEHWLQDRFHDRAANSRHFIAITAYPARAVAFGIEASNVLPMWDWVGGRYSLWSAIGLPIALLIGMDNFERMLAGAARMDEHFRSAPWSANLPVILALVGIWNSNFLGAETLAIVPYEERLFHLPGYLQQLDMESNGKRVTLGNQPVHGHTAPVIWGGLGTNVQHAFFQLLHQGTRLIPVDFILPLRNPHAPPKHHDMLIANCLAQAEALMVGRMASELAGTSPVPGIDLPLHRATPGSQPSNLILIEALEPSSLGALLALYEHKTFVQGVLWEINSFDQWGVELGKQLAQRLLDEINGGRIDAHDGSTCAALARYLATRT